MLLRLRTRGGEYRWMSGPAHPVQDAAGRTLAVTAGLRDVDELVRSRERLRATLDSQLEPNVTFEAVRDATGALVDLRYVDANGAALDYLRLTRERFVGATLLDISPGQLVHGPMRQYFHTIETGEPTVLDDYVYPLEIMAEDRHFDIRATRVGDGLTLTWHDVTDRNAAVRRLAESEEHYRLLADNTSDVVALLRDGVIAWISPSVTDSFGGRPDQWVGRCTGDILHPDDVEAHADLVDRADRGERAVGRVRFRTPEGAWHWVEIHMSQYVGAEGRVEGQITTAHVVDAEVEAEATLERMARFDSLTGLLNRGEVVRRLQAFTTHERTPGQQLGVLFCDVDEFKGINDVYGHAVGDLVLRTLAQRVTRAVRREDVVARMGGDELLVILSGVHDLDEVLRIAGKVRAGAGQPIALGTRGSGFVLPTLSIGATIAGSGEDADALLARADRAMYEAKHAGRNRVVPLPPTGSS